MTSSWLSQPRGCCRLLCTMVCVHARVCIHPCSTRTQRAPQTTPPSFLLPVVPPPGMKVDPPDRLEVQMLVRTHDHLSENL